MPTFAAHPFTSLEPYLGIPAAGNKPCVVFLVTKSTRLLGVYYAGLENTCMRVSIA